MKRLALLLAVLLGVGAASYALTRMLWPVAAVAEDQMTWLTREFALSPTQAAAIEKLHYDYVPVCSEHCAMIVEARERLAAQPTDPALRVEVAQKEKLCADATLAHVHEVAAQMDAAHGRRFLELVVPKISRHQHHGPFGLK
ncbi:MAG: hypothetical protein Q8M02_14865 [Candidatus Didemnitutus sp.]|nr:hypothetical protein [Candidatus Didemnitutus sp.]